MPAKDTPETSAVDRLVGRLSHPNLISRGNAARKLGEIGDSAAIPHLQAALRLSYAQRSTVWNALVGWFWTLVITTVSTMLFLVLVILCQGAPTTDIGVYRGFYEWLVNLRRTRDPFVRTCITALERISEKNATPESRAIVPFLHGIAADPLHHSLETRDAARLAARRIEARTEAVKSMPVAAEAPEVEADRLPIVAGR